MTLDPDSFNTASTAIHIAQGAALLVLGLTEAYAGLEPGKRIKLFSPAALLAGGIAMALIMLYFLGGWNLDNTMGALKMKNGFFIFVSFACFYASAGLSQLTFLSSGEKSRGWHYIFLLFLAVIAVLYFGMAKRVGPEAAAKVGIYHSAMGVTLLAAVLLKLLYGFLPRRSLHLVWTVLLLMTSFQLLSYREIPGAFDFRLVSLRTEAMPAAPVVPAAKPANKNAKTPPVKRARN